MFTFNIFNQMAVHNLLIQNNCLKLESIPGQQRVTKISKYSQQQQKFISCLVFLTEQTHYKSLFSCRFENHSNSVHP